MDLHLGFLMYTLILVLQIVSFIYMPGNDGSGSKWKSECKTDHCKNVVMGDFSSLWAIQIVNLICLIIIFISHATNGFMEIPVISWFNY